MYVVVYRPGGSSSVLSTVYRTLDQALKVRDELRGWSGNHYVVRELSPV